MGLISTVDTRFKARARIHGITWSCPNCGHVHREKGRPRGNWRVKCSDPSCRRVFVLGVIFYQVKPGPHRMPRDWIIPTADEPLPLGPVSKYGDKNRDRETHAVI